jgi:hypothetical protein
MPLKSPPKDWEIPELEVDVRPAPQQSKTMDSSLMPTEDVFEAELVPTSIATDRRLPVSVCLSEREHFDDADSLCLPDLDLAELPRTKCKNDEASSLPWPTLLPLAPAEQTVNAEQVQSQVPWGAPPTQLLATPVYAFWVFRGQRQLMRRIVEQRKAIVVLEAQRHEIALEWFEAHRTQLRTDGRFSKEFAILEKIEQQYQLTASEYNRKRAEGLGAGQQLREQLARASEQLEHQRCEAAQLNVQREQARMALQREQAKRKRLDIDCRAGLIDNSSLEARSASLDVAIAQAQTQLKSIDTTSNERQQAVHRAQLEVRRHEDLQRTLERREQVQLEITQVGMRNVLNAADNAKLEIMQRALSQRDNGLIDTAACRQLMLHEGALVTEVQKLAMLLAAFDAFDRTRVRQGLWLLLVTVGSLLVALVVRWAA